MKLVLIHCGKVHRIRENLPHLWTTVLVVCLFAGCTSYHAQPLVPEKELGRLESRRLDSVELRKFLEENSGGRLDHWPIQKWDFKRLLLASYYFHPDLEVARAQWHVAQAGILVAKGRPNPVVSGGPGYNFSAATGVTPWMPFGSLDVPVETSGKRGIRTALAEKNVESARWNYVQQAWQIRSRLRQTLLEYRMTRSRLNFLQQELEAQTKVVDLLKKRLEAGEISSVELISAKMPLKKIMAEVQTTQSGIEEKREQLAMAIGISRASLDGIKIDSDDKPMQTSHLTTKKARIAALVGRADIRSALADYAASEEALRLEIAKQYPDVHFSPGYQYDQGENKWTFGLSVELPVINQNQGPIREAEAKRSLEKAKFLQLQSQVESQIDLALNRLVQSQKQEQISKNLLKLSIQQTELEKGRLRAGMSTQLELAQAEGDLASLRLMHSENEMSVCTALWALEDALQQPADTFCDFEKWNSKMEEDR